MSEQPLVVDGAAISALAAPVSSAGSGLPANVTFDFSGSSSATVAAAGEEFSLWVSVHTALASGGLIEAGRVANEVVSTYDTTDAALAGGGGM